MRDAPTCTVAAGALAPRATAAAGTAAIGPRSWDVGARAALPRAIQWRTISTMSSRQCRGGSVSMMFDATVIVTSAPQTVQR